MSPALSIILVNYNERDYLRDVLKALPAEFPSGHAEIIVVDNASSDGSMAMVTAEFPNVIAVEPGQNLLYGKGNNLGVSRASGDWVMILNPDVSWTSGQLQKLLAWAQTKPGVDVVAPRLLYRDGRTQISAHGRFPNLWTVFVDYCLPLQQAFMTLGRHPYQLSAREHETTRVIAHATGACLLIRRTVWQQVGEFDPQFTMYLEETDWQARLAQSGYQVWLMGEAAITHFGSAKKSFAQASPHYLWGLRRYAEKHWSARAQSLLPPVVMLASLCSVVFLLVLYIPSYVIPGGQRIRHYARIYAGLISRLFVWPRQAPTASS